MNRQTTKKSSTALRGTGAPVGAIHAQRAFSRKIWGLTLAAQGIALSLAMGGLAVAQMAPNQRDEGPRYPTAGNSADLPAVPAQSVRRARGAQNVETEVFTANAPDTYTIVRGDTRWGIAGRFLKKPWRWPEIWQVNRDQIRNRHWIYPGQTIVLDRVSGTMRLGSGSAAGAGGTVKLSPQVRIETDREAIPSIPQNVIEPFLTQPIVVDTATMRDAPRIVASKERVVLGRGDVAYVAGITDPSVASYQLFRPGRALKDPDTGEVIAWQADYLGTAQVTRQGDPATVTITQSKLEMGVGDRLVPTVKTGIVNYMPHALQKPVAGRIVAIYDGVAYAGKNMVVALNRGSADGLDTGTVLAIKTFGRTITDRTKGGRETITLPAERNGLMFVFRVFDRIAYGLITSSVDPVQVGDVFTEP